MEIEIETDRRANSRCEQTIIRYIAPHVARIERDDGRWLRSLRSSKCSGLDRRLRIAVAQDRIRCMDGQTLIDGGLADAVATAMSASGRDVRIIELPWIFSRALEPLSHWTDQQQRFAAVLAERGRILGQCRDFFDRADLLRTLGEVFSTSRISVAVDNLETATKLANYLRGRVPQAVFVGMEYSLMQSPEMRIFPTRSFAFANQCQIAVAFGTRAASSQRLQSITAERPDCIRIGLLSSPIERLRASDRVALEAFYGPRCFDADDCPLFLPIHAAILPAAEYPATKRRFGEALERKRMLFWNNDQRNRYLAKIGRQLQQRNVTELHVAGIDELR